MLFLAQPEPRHPEQHPDSWPHSLHLGPAMALGHHVFKTWTFRLQFQDLISNPCAGVDRMQKLEPLLPHGRKPSCGHAVQPLG